MKYKAALLLFLAMASPAFSASFEEAEAAFNAGAYADARSIAEELAQSGDIHAMTLLGRIYRDGRGVDRNLDMAIDWYAKAV